LPAVVKSESARAEIPQGFAVTSKSARNFSGKRRNAATQLRDQLARDQSEVVAAAVAHDFGL
jgi:hypothetical protein